MLRAVTTKEGVAKNSKDEHADEKERHYVGHVWNGGREGGREGGKYYYYELLHVMHTRECTRSQ